MAGATGLVGRHLVERLAAEPDYGEVVVLTRRPLPDPPWDVGGVTIHPVDFETLAEGGAVLDGVSADHVFCALGTTRRKAGSRDAFRRVDHDYPLALARWARGEGVRHFSLVSAVGADPGSRFFYSRVKGEVEEAVAEVGLPSVSILRPSVIAGNRREFRLGESLSRVLLSVVPGRYRPVHADEIAGCMVRLALEERDGIHRVESEEIRGSAAS